MNSWKNILKLTIGIGTLLFFFGILLFGDGINVSIHKSLKIFGIYLLYALVMSMVNGYFFHYIRIVFPWETESKKQLIYGFVGSIVLSILVLLVLRYFVWVYLYQQNPANFLKNTKFYFFFGISFTVIIVLLFYFFYFYKYQIEQKVTESQVVAKTETAKYESLKSQLDPHFLFNSLNVLTSLIGENPELAEKFTTKLSKVYRYVLEQKNKDLIPLDEELKFARTYMELLKMRFEDAIQFEILEEASNPEFKIVPLSLQILLENAVKHNVISSDNPLSIKIYEDKRNLIVENKMHLKKVIEKSTKVGLRNINERYRLITKRPVKIEDENDIFKITLPLLTQKIKIMETERLEESKYIKARKRVDEIKDFYSSFISYLILMPFLFFIWYKFTPNTIQWFWFPMFGWGIGLVFQGFKAFGNNSFLGENWEQRKIKEIMEKDKTEYWK